MEEVTDKIIKNISIVFDKDYIEDQRRTISDGVFSYKNANLLITYYQQLKTQLEKDVFVEIIFNDHLLNGYSSGLSFVVLFHLGFRKSTLEKIIPEKSGQFLSLIYQLFNKNINRFNEEELDLVNSIAINNNLDGPFSSTTAEKIINSIIEIRFDNFEKHLQGIDLEIMGDKQQVEEYLKNFGFDEKYNKTLNLIEKYIDNSELDETVIPGGIIGIYRTFFDDFYLDIANKIAEINGLSQIPEDIDPKKTEKSGHAIAYIAQEFGISKDEDKLLSGHYGITNGQGAHKLLSNKKYFRLVRNISIEIALFMLEKLNDYSKDLKQKPD